MSALVFKTTTDPYVGRVSFFRVYSGSLKGDSSIHNATTKMDERVAHVFTMRGKTQEPLNEVVAGDIGAMAKLNHTVTGDTLADKTSPSCSRDRAARAVCCRRRSRRRLKATRTS